MAKVFVHADDSSNALFNVIDTIKALQRFEGVLQAPLADDSEADYSIGDCLEDIKDFLEQLDEECTSEEK